VAETEAEQRISIVRRFNRFYTKQIGLLGEGYLETSFSLTEARVLYELGAHGVLETSALKDALAIDVNAKPEWRLENLVMQERARWLMSKVSDLFLGSARDSTTHSHSTSGLLQPQSAQRAQRVPGFSVPSVVQRGIHPVN